MSTVILLLIYRKAWCNSFFVVQRKHVLNHTSRASFQVFKFQYVARNLYKVVRDRARFSIKIFFAPKIGKVDKWVPKTRFFEFTEKFVHCFLLNLYYNENLYYLLCSSKNPYLGRFLSLGYRPKFYQPIRLQDFLINHIPEINISVWSDSFWWEEET